MGCGELRNCRCHYWGLEIGTASISFRVCPSNSCIHITFDPTTQTPGTCPIGELPQVQNDFVQPVNGLWGRTLGAWPELTKCDFGAFLEVSG